MIEWFQVMFFAIFFLAFGFIVFTLIKGASQWNKNNHSPRLTVLVIIVAKRIQVGHSHHTDASGFHHTHAYTTYYATFQVESGDRMELSVPGREYGLLVEGDRGQLTFQGTRYLGFARQ